MGERFSYEIFKGDYYEKETYFVQKFENSLEIINFDTDMRGGLKIIFSTVYVEEKNVSNLKYMMRINKNEDFIPVNVYEETKLDEKDEIIRLYHTNDTLNSILENKYLKNKIKWVLWDYVPVQVTSYEEVVILTGDGEIVHHTYKIFNENK